MNLFIIDKDCSKNDLICSTLESGDEYFLTASEVDPKSNIYLVISYRVKIKTRPEVKVISYRSYNEQYPFKAY
jgi:hypothetical protein